MSELKTTVRRRVLGTNLRRLREEKGLYLEDAAKELGCHPAKVSRIESGRSGIRQLDLRVLLDLYGVTDEAAREGWLALARESRRQRWWRSLEDKLPGNFLELVGLEEEVASCRGFEPTVIHGLLQTESYAAAIIQGAATGPLSDERQTRLRVRMKRQQALHRTDSPPLNLWMVMGEGALRQQIGGRQVLVEQLRHLAEVAQLPHVTVQVLPFTAGALMGGILPFTLYSFPAPVQLEVVVLEQFTSQAYLESADDTEYYDTAFKHVLASALSPLDSEALILRIADELAQV
ncbi:helix-turn-helix domain-containing protein [Streptomyces mayteni]